MPTISVARQRSWWARLRTALRFAHPTVRNHAPLRFLQRLRGVDVEKRALALDRDLGDRLAVLAIRCRAPTSPSSVISSLKKRRDHSTGLPRRPSLTGTAIRLPRSGAKASISRSIRSRDRSAAYRQDRSPRRRHAAGTAAMPALTELARPSAKSGLRDEGHVKARQRLLDLPGLMAGDDDHAGCLRGQRLFGHDPHQRLAVEFGQAACWDRPCGSSGRRRG